MFASNTSAANGANYIEDVFSTYLYTGNGSTQTITNGIDLSGKGGLVWIKNRTNAASHALWDTARGAGTTSSGTNTHALSSNLTNAEGSLGGTIEYLNSFSTSGFSVTGNSSPYNANGSGINFASWTFRKQPKFYTQGTYTGTGSVQNIAHDLGSVPGFIIVKDTTNNGSAWAVYHRSNGNTKYMWLNSDAAPATSAGYWNNTDPTSTEFTVGTNGNVNQSGATFVYYAFAHDAGGFGLTGTDNVISCGSFTTDISRNATITLGYEPQWVLIKQTSAANSWGIYDTMRGWAYSNQNYLIPNDAMAEGVINASNFVPTATGFNVSSPYENNATYIYIAIRRGPMKVPTSGTSVFAPVTWTGTGSTQQITTGFFPDMFIGINRGAVHARTYATDILRGLGVTLPTNLTEAENSESGNTFNMTGYSNNNGNLNSTFGGGQTYVGEFFKRAPSFFDEVCYTGNGSTQNITHNLGVAPEFLIVKPRNSSTYDWNCYHVSLGNTKYIALNTTLAASSAVSLWNNTTPTSTVFTVNHPAVNDSGGTYVAYLFATCAGVSKVGSYTGTATTLQVDCGFTGGARFVLIKRTDSTGDWYVWDTARGIVSGNDPYLLLNSTAAEVTSTDYVDTYSAGFEISSTAPAAINASGGTFIFLAIA